VKIAHVFKDAYPPVPGGIEGYVADVTAGLADRGHTAEVYSAGVRRARQDLLANGVTVRRHSELARIVSTPVSPGLVRAVRRLDADVVHLHMPHPTGELGALLRTTTTPMIASFHAPVARNPTLQPVYRILQRRVLSQMRIVLVASSEMRDEPELAPIQRNVRVLPYGVSPRLVTPEYSSQAHDAHRGNGLRLLFVGRLVYYKGVDVLLEAVKCCDRDVSLTIAGAGPLRADLEAQAARLGLGDQVSFAGRVTDSQLVQLYQTHDVFVMPSVSRAEAFGLAMAEAMASGLPAVSTRLGTGTDWVNVDGKTGVVVAPDDPRALSGAIQQLKNAELRTRLGRAARARAQSTFGFSHHLDELVAIYDNVLTWS
jgi:rhamnosyl/mannosyltransferase